MTRILFNLSLQQHDREYEGVIRYLAQSGWATDVLIGWSGELARQAIGKYQSLGLRVFRTPPGLRYGDPLAKPGDPPDTDTALVALPGSGKPFPTQAQEHESALVWDVVAEALGQFSPDILRSAPQMVQRLFHASQIGRTMRHIRNWGLAVVDGLAPDALVLGMSHSCAHIDNALMQAARMRGIPVAIVPLMPFHGKRYVVPARGHMLHGGVLPQVRRADYDPINRLCAAYRPGWIAEHDEVGGMFMFDPLHILVAEPYGLAERDVWQKPSPDIDLAFVNADVSVQLLQESGFPMEKVKVCGFPLLDEIVPRLSDASYRKSVFERMGLEDGEPFILHVMDNGAEHRTTDWPTHWANFDWVHKALATTGIRVVVSLHPGCNPDNYRFAEEKYNIRIANALKTQEIFPWCKFVVTYPSSTNPYIDMFDKPAVICDWYNLVGSIEWLFQTKRSKYVDKHQDLQSAIDWAVSEIGNSRQIGSGDFQYKKCCEIIREEVAILIESGKSDPNHGRA